MKRGMFDTDVTRVWLRVEGTRIGGGEVREEEAKGFRRIVMATEGTESRAGLGSGETDRGRSNRQGARQVEEAQWATWLLGVCGQRVNRVWERI